MPDMVTVRSEYRFTEQEKADIALRLANTQVELDQAQDAKKAIASQYKSEIDGHKARVRILSGKLRDGYEMRDFECELHLDFDAGMRRYIDPETGEVRKTEPLTEQDRQQKMEV